LLRSAKSFRYYVAPCAQSSFQLHKQTFIGGDDGHEGLVTGLAYNLDVPFTVKTSEDMDEQWKLDIDDLERSWNISNFVAVLFQDLHNFEPSSAKSWMD